MFGVNSTEASTRALEKLGFSEPPAADLAGLRALYRAWCLNVPFDNLRKMIALRTGAQGPLPGTTAGDFLSHWTDHNAGGTCWPSSNALHAVLRACGFDAMRITGSMFDMGIDNHGSVIVRVEEKDWLVDSSMLTMEPLPLVPGGTFITEHPIYHTEIDPDGEGFFMWSVSPPLDTLLPCRLLERDVPESVYAANFERSREMSVFNERIYARRNFEDRLLVIFGGNLAEVTSEGMEIRPLDRRELLSLLESPFCYSRELIEAWVGCGGLDASLTPHEPGSMPSIDRLPPSRRQPA